MNLPSITDLIVTYLVIINIATFAAFGIDKWKAQHNAWRIPEATLLIMAIIGGSIGAWLGMRTWHHKTLHPKFQWGVPAILVIQLLLAGYLIGKF